MSGRADPPGPSHKMGNSRFQNGEHARCASSRPLCIVLRELRAHQQEEKALVMWSHVGSLMLRLTTRKFRELETRLAMSKRFIGGFGLRSRRCLCSAPVLRHEKELQQLVATV